MEPTIEPTPDDDERIQALFREIARSGVLPDHVPAFEAADAVLCALEMRLPRSQAEEVARDVPPTLQLLIGRCVAHRADRPEISFDEQAFLRLVASALRISVGEAERVTRAVFAAVQELLPEEEILDVRDKLPAALNALWYPPRPREPTDVRAGARPVEEPTESILREIEASGTLPAEISASGALQAVLCTFSLELTGHEAQELAGASPTMHRLLAPCVSHRGERPHVMDRPTFVHRLAGHLGVDEPRAERIARTVLAAVRGRLPPDEIPKLDNRIPRSLRTLWG